jgi:hypothetical protein
MQTTADLRPPEASAPISELALARLVTEVKTKHGILPAGASGTVVHVFPDATAYLIEFSEPFHCVAVVDASAVAG